MEGSELEAVPQGPVRRPSARQRRAMSAMIRPGTGRPQTASRRPYSAYSRRDGEAENETKCDPPQTSREWWRFYVKVSSAGRCLQQQ